MSKPASADLHPNHAKDTEKGGDVIKIPVDGRRPGHSSNAYTLNTMQEAAGQATCAGVLAGH